MEEEGEKAAAREGEIEEEGAKAADSKEGAKGGRGSFEEVGMDVAASSFGFLPLEVEEEKDECPSLEEEEEEEETEEFLSLEVDDDSEGIGLLSTLDSRSMDNIVVEAFGWGVNGAVNGAYSL